jgi:hypothetical protein
MLSVRIIQGFIYWGGGSRRFIYAPSKLQPGRAHMDGEQVSDRDAWRAVRHRSRHQFHNHPVAHYDAAALSALPKSAFANDYAYNKFEPGPFGIRAVMAAAATVTLPPPVPGATPQARTIRLTDVDGRTFSATLAVKP